MGEMAENSYSGMQNLVVAKMETRMMPAVASKELEVNATVIEMMIIVMIVQIVIAATE
jgi:hypothetical protein